MKSSKPSKYWNLVQAKLIVGIPQRHRVHSEAEKHVETAESAVLVVPLFFEFVVE